MNIEIKFRAWDSNTETMITEPAFINVGGDGTFQVFIENEPSSWLGEDEGVYLMQFTGCKDKNGVEIYEGDIVKEKYLDFVDDEVSLDRVTKERVSMIEYRAHGFWIKDESFGWEGESLWNWDLIEVIGNIYEHPELLTNDKKHE